MVSQGVSTVQCIFIPNLSRRKRGFHLRCSPLSTATRPVIIQLFSGRGRMLYNEWLAEEGRTLVLDGFYCKNFVILIMFIVLRALCLLMIVLFSAACEVGFYKPVAGDGVCGKCPQHSHSGTRAAVSCPCDSNYYRAADDPPAAACSRKHKHTLLQITTLHDVHRCRIH